MLPSASGSGDSPPVYLDPYASLAAEAWSRTLATLPVLLGKSDRDPKTGDGFSYFDFQWVDATGAYHDVITGTGADALYRWTTVDDRPSQEDFLAHEWTRQLLQGSGDTPVPFWTSPEAPAFLQLGNELEGTSEPDAEAWVVLRTLLDMRECGLPATTKTVYPGLPSPSQFNEDALVWACALHEGAIWTPCTWPHYIGDLIFGVREVGGALRIRGAFALTQFELVRAALVVLVEDAVGAPVHFSSSLDPTTFADPPLYDRLTALFHDPATAHELVHVWTNFQLIQYLMDLGVMLGILTLPFSPGPVLSSPTELDRENVWHQVLLALLCRNMVKAPYDVMDFHWYCQDASYALSGAEPDVAFTPLAPAQGNFLYLAYSRPYLNAIRFVLRSWWSNGDGVPLWCTETGTSSLLSPMGMAEIGVQPEGGAASPSCDAPTYTYDDLTGPQWHFRVDPGSVKDFAAVLGISDVTDFALWPEWAFTSELEQARQVWTRLSYFAGLGVERTLWYTADADLHTAAGSCAGTLRKFAGHGLTDNGYASFEDDAGQPIPYASRRKKQAWCALRRWNQYLDRYLGAGTVAELDGWAGAKGRAGFYAVVFRRAPDSIGGDHDAATYPYALLAWADPQSYDWSACTADCFDSPEPMWTRRSLSFLRASETLPHPIQVQTLPQAEERTDGFDSVCQPCLGSAPDDTAPADGGASGYTHDGQWRFGPSQAPDPTPCADGCAAWTFDIVSDADPLLILLPEGAVLALAEGEVTPPVVSDGLGGWAFVPDIGAATLASIAGA
ncbi:hypothetical protein L6R50_02775 [Myxococcota bacterium]|nr:hypothetical protein [Myxococcota bacterium]